MSLLGTGGATLSHVQQITTCTAVQKKIMPRCCRGPNHFITLLPGRVALKAMITTIVFPRMQDRQRENAMPNAVWRSPQDQDVGCPIKANAHRKQSHSELRIRKLSSELLALTRGVCRLMANIKATASVKQDPSRATASKVMPIVSL